MKDTKACSPCKRSFRFKFEVLKVKKETKVISVWWMWFVAALFYGYEFLLRIAPSVMVPDLMRAFLASAASLGTLSAYYYYGYAAMQIPAGILLDYYGVRIPILAAIFLVVFGNFLFALAHPLWEADLGRFFMGVGSAFAFVSSIKLAVMWFPSNKLPLLIGLTNLFGVLGAVAGEGPLAFAFSHFSWRLILMFVSMGGLLLLLLAYLYIRDRKQCSRGMCTIPVKQHRLWSSLKSIIGCRYAWLLSLYAGLMVAPISGFAELWAIPFLQKVYNLPRSETAFMISLIFIGIGLGGPTWGFIASKGYPRKTLLWLGSLVALLSFSTILFVQLPSSIWIGVFLGVFGFFTSSMLLCFSLNCELHPPELSGIVVGFTNMVVMLFGTMFQPLIGFIMDHSAGNIVQHGAKIFSLHAYRDAFSVLLVCQTIALSLWGFIREEKHVS